MDGVANHPDTLDDVGFSPGEIRSMIDQVPQHRSYKLMPHNNGMQVTVMPDAWRGSDRSEDDPGRVDQFYFEDEELLVIDLSRSPGDE